MRWASRSVISATRGTAMTELGSGAGRHRLVRTAHWLLTVGLLAAIVAYALR